VGGHPYALQLEGPQPPEAALVELSTKGQGKLHGQCRPSGVAEYDGLTDFSTTQSHDYSLQGSWPNPKPMHRTAF